jgi:hypothetical protein
MKNIHHISRPALAMVATLSFGLLTGLAQAADLKLSGANEVPAVTTAATGSGSITVADDGTMSGSIKTTGVQGTMAHIHVAPAGKNGPVAIPLTKGDDGATWSVPAGTKLTADQLKSFKAGELYVNVHSETNKGGEIRAQLAP